MSEITAEDINRAWERLRQAPLPIDSEDLEMPEKSENHPELTFYPTPFSCDFWIWKDRYLTDGQGVRAYVMRGDEKIVCGYAVVEQQGSLLIHVYGDDEGDGSHGAVVDEHVFFEYEHPLYGWVEMQVFNPEFWHDKQSYQMFVQTPGDFDGNGQLTITDVLRCAKAAFEGSGENCDLNNDGVTDIRDVALIAAVVFRGEDSRKLCWPQG